MASSAYKAGFLRLVNGTKTFATDGYYAILVDGYVFSDAHDAYSDISATELSTAGDYDRVALGSKTVAYSTDKVRYDCANISFGDPVSIGPADGIVILEGTAATPGASDVPVFYQDLNDLQSTDAVFSVNTPNGLYEIEINVVT